MLAMLFIVLLAPVARKENKEPQAKGCDTREGRRYFCPLTSPGVSAQGFPCRVDVPDGEKPLRARWRGGQGRRVSGTQHGYPGVTGRRASSGGLVSPHIRRAHFVSHAAPISLPL